MSMWLSIFIPIIYTIFLVIFYRKWIVWWELALLIVPSAILIVLLKFIMISYTTSDIEYRGTYTKHIIYYEEWDEKVSCRHPIMCTRSCGKNCVTTYVCGHVHAYDVDYHPPRWSKVDNLNQEYSISESEFNELQKRFSTNPYFVELNRDYYSIDGNAYYTNWNQKSECSDNITNESSYTNKVRASHSIFKFEDISQKEKNIWKLYDYPIVDNKYNQSIILGMPADLKTKLKIEHLNGFYGSSMQFRTYILFFKGQTMEAAFKQRSYWEGGNKNEFIVCIGIDSISQKIQWSKCFSWMDKPDLEVRTESFLFEKSKEKKFNISDLADWMAKEIPLHWKRKNFKDFDYLEIELTSTQFTWIMIIVAIYNLVISIWIVKNEFR